MRSLLLVAAGLALSAALGSAFQALPDTILPPIEPRLSVTPELHEALAARGDLLALVQQADALQEQGKFQEAAAAYRKVGPQVERELGALHPSVRDMMRSMANVHLLIGDLRRAEEIAQKAFSRENRRRRKSRKRLAASEALLADVYLAQGRETDAVTHSSRQMVLLSDGLGSSHLETSYSMANLAAAQLEAGDLEQAALLARRAMTIQDVYLGKDTAKRARTYFVMAVVFENEARQAEAVAMLERTLRTLEAALGRSHPRLLPVLGKLGYLQESLGAWEAAAGHYLRSISILRQFRGEAVKEIARLCDHLALLELRRENVEAAKRYFQRGLAIRNQIGPSRDTAFGLSEVVRAAILLHTGTPKKALDHSIEALDRVTTTPGAFRPAMAVAWAVTGGCYIEAGDARRAVSYSRRALERSIELFGDKDPLVIAFQVALARAYRYRGALDQAMEIADQTFLLLRRRDAARSTQKRQALPNPYRVDLMALRAELLLDAERTDEAAQLVRRARSLARRTRPDRRSTRIRIGLADYRLRLQKADPAGARRVGEELRGLLQGVPPLSTGAVEAALLDARTLTLGGQPSRAEAALEELARRVAKGVGAEHPLLVRIWRRQAEARTALARLEDAERSLRNASDLAWTALAPASPETVGVTLDLVANLAARNLPRKARPLLERTIRVAEENLGSTNFMTQRLMAALNDLGRNRGSG